MDKKFEVIKKDNHTLIQVLAKKLDTSIAPSFKSELVMIAGNGEKNMIIDLSNTEYCDSSGLSSILVANRLCKNAKGQFILSGLQNAVERLITISQLDSVLTITDNLEKAESKINN
ncbi:MAG: STAS domain-containing protein [Bacteroidales bacterium]|nr:STAS domain-containing protein [Bacteroidales bacterium]